MFDLTWRLQPRGLLKGKKQVVQSRAVEKWRSGSAGSTSVQGDGTTGWPTFGWPGETHRTFFIGPSQTVQNISGVTMLLSDFFLFFSFSVESICFKSIFDISFSSSLRKIVYSIYNSIDTQFKLYVLKTKRYSYIASYPLGQICLKKKKEKRKENHKFMTSAESLGPMGVFTS